MYDLYAELQSSLNTAVPDVPAYYDHFVTEDTVLPCISWNIISMANDKVGDTMVYDNASVTVKYWTTNGLADLVAKEQVIDAKMLDSGYRRTGGNTLYIDSNILCGVMNYACKIKEEIL